MLNQPTIRPTSTHSTSDVVSIDCHKTASYHEIRIEPVDAENGLVSLSCKSFADSADEDIKDKNGDGVVIDLSASAFGTVTVENRVLSSITVTADEDVDGDFNIFYRYW